jgi:hypothetical protein
VSRALGAEPIIASGISKDSDGCYSGGDLFQGVHIFLTETYRYNRSKIIKRAPESRNSESR